MPNEDNLTSDRFYDESAGGASEDQLSQPPSWMYDVIDFLHQVKVWVGDHSVEVILAALVAVLVISVTVSAVRMSRQLRDRAGWTL